MPEKGAVEKSGVGGGGGRRIAAAPAGTGPRTDPGRGTPPAFKSVGFPGLTKRGARRVRSWRRRAGRMEEEREGEEGGGREAKEGRGGETPHPWSGWGTGAEGPELRAEIKVPARPLAGPRSLRVHAPTLAGPSRPLTLQDLGGGGNQGSPSWAPRPREPASPSPLPFWPGLSIPPNSYAGESAAPRPSLLFT